MHKVYIEMPSGATSKPHEFAEELEAEKLFDSFVSQMQPWKDFVATVWCIGNGKRAYVEVNNAA